MENFKAKAHPPYLCVRNARNGKGIFTTEALQPGDFIYWVKGKLLTVPETESKGVQSKKSANAYRFSSELYLDPEGELGDFLNHSCEPNAYVFKHDQGLYVRAIGHIPADSEILIDYSTIMRKDDMWTMDCNCGTRSCRGKIQKIDLLPEKVREQYISADIVPDYILA